MAVGTLFVVSTPIGNLSDMSERAGEVLRSARRLLAEDTRRARVLLDRVGATGRPRSFHARNEAGRTEEALGWLGAGRDVALVSDAGTPLLSDPGERLPGVVGGKWKDERSYRVEKVSYTAQMRWHERGVGYGRLFLSFVKFFHTL